jgi:hypothetical protein
VGEISWWRGANKKVGRLVGGTAGGSSQQVVQQRATLGDFAGCIQYPMDLEKSLAWTEWTVQKQTCQDVGAVHTVSETDQFGAILAIIERPQHLDWWVLGELRQRCFQCRNSNLDADLMEEIARRVETNCR